MNNYEESDIINVGSGREISIARLAVLIKEVTGFKGKIIYDRTKPDGMPRRLLDITRLKSLGWQAKTTLAEGLKLSYYHSFLRK
jgi:GDP-L-fucose synthase